jgi:Zn-dependent membrane protease YugP
MYIDSYYLILILPCILLSLYAQTKVSSTFNKYLGVNSLKGFTGAQVARRILDLNGLHNVTVECISGKLTDHYDPSKKVVRLSDDVYHSTSVSAIGVAAHETGHAVQHSVGYFPLRVRTGIFPIVRISSQLAMPLAVLGLILSLPSLLEFGILLFSATVLFQFITLPVEYNASRRAIKILDETGILADSEIPSCKKVLSAAAMTYLASALTALMSLLRLILISRNRRN